MRYVFLDGLRGLAALFVVLHHFALTWDERRRWFGAAPLAVDFFFCLSGFVIAHAYQERLRAGMPLREYFARRLVRLYPMYLLGALLGVAGLAELKTHGLTDFTWEGIGMASALHLAYLPYFHGFHERVFGNDIAAALFPLNNPAWSLFFELICANGLYALAVRTWRHAPAAIALLGSVALVLAVRRYGASPGWGGANFAGGVPRVSYAFFTGVAMFQYRDRLAILGKAHAGLVLLAAALLFGVPRTPAFDEFWLGAALVAVPLLVAAATTVELPAASAAHAASLYSGRISYPLYCVHFPLLMLVAAFQWRPPWFAPALLLFVALSIAVAHALMVLADEPLRAWLGARLARRALRG